MNLESRIRADNFSQSEFLGHMLKLVRYRLYYEILKCAPQHPGSFRSKESRVF